MKFQQHKLFVAVVSATFGVTIHAQTPILEEVVVKAQKRAQLAADIGMTLSVFSGTDFEKLGFEKAKDIASFTPGLSTSNATSGGTPIFAIRGIGLDDFNSNNTSGVSVYIDEVLAPYPVFANGQLFDLERVEVLKGPQGTLYGKNTTGGAINFVSVKPGEEFSGYATLGLSRWNTKKLEGAIGGAVAENVNSRLALSLNKGDGWQTDVDTGAEYGSKDDFSIRSLTSFEYSDAASLLLNLHYTKDRGVSISPQNLNIDNFVTPPPGSSFGAVSGNPADVRVGDLDLQRDETGYGTSLQFNFELEPFTLTSITAFDNFERNSGDNYDGAPINTNDIVFNDKFDVYSQELRLSSNSWGRFNWIAGLTYSYDKIDAETDIDVGGFFLAPGISLGATSIYEQKSTSVGAYLHTETYLSENLRLTFGLRYSNDKREFDGGTFDRDGFATGVPFGAIALLDAKESDNHVTGRIGLDYAIDDTWLLYTSVATSYKAGVFYAAPVAAQEALSYVEPEEVLAYEAGFKGTLFSNSMQINGAIYHYQYDDRQSLITVTTAGALASTFATLGNVPESEINGAELEVQWLPTDKLEIRLGAAYIDAEVSRAPARIRGLELLQPITVGETLSQAPEWSYNAMARYEWPIGDFLGSLQVQYSWSDKQVAALADSNAIYGGIDNLGLRANLESSSGEWLLSAWVSNLEDNNSTTYSFTNVDGSNVVYRQSPLNYGLEVTYSF